MTKVTDAVIEDIQEKAKQLPIVKERAKQLPIVKEERAKQLPIVKEERAKQLPIVKGYKILCTLPNIENKFDSGILKADKTVKYEELLSNVLFVVALGDMAYADQNRFPTGPWCKPGDFIVTRANTGTRIKIHDREFRIINDDSVEAVVEDPRGIQRALVR